MRGRGLVLAGAIAWVASVLLWVGRDERARQVAFPAFSALDTSEEGLSLARAYLEARGTRTAILSQPLDQAGVPPRAVVLRVAPRLRLEEQLAAASRGENVPPRREEDEDAASEGDGDAKDDRAAEPDARQRGLRRLVDRLFPQDDDDGRKAADGTEDDSTDGRGEPAGGGAARTPLAGPAEDAWIRSGGRLVLALDEPWGSVIARDQGDAAPLAKVHPSWRGVRELRPLSARVLEGRDLVAGHAIFARARDSVVHRIPLGRGDVVLLSCPDVLRNDRLDVGDHLGLLEALTGGRPTWFDERCHGLGSEAGLVPLLRGWGLGTFLLLLAVATATASWRGATSVGPPEDDHLEHRTEAVDFVDSVAVLYGRALTRAEGLSLLVRDLELEVAQRTGLRGAELAARVRELLGGGERAAPPVGEVSRDELERRLGHVNAAMSAVLRGRAGGQGGARAPRPNGKVRVTRP